MPDFSILTPSFNQAAFLGQCMNSVTSQVGATFEHIVMDNDSNDGSKAILQANAGSSLKFLSEPDDGQTDALRKALLTAQGTYVGWLNADEFYEPNALASAQRVFARHPEASVVYGDFRRVAADGSIIRVNRQWRYRTDVGAIVTPIIQTCSAFFRRDKMLAVGAFDSPWKYVMDWDLFVRMIRYDFEAVHVAEIWSNYGMHAEAKTATAYSGFLSEVQQFRSALLPGVPPEDIERLRRSLYRRMVLDMASAGVLWEKALFKVWGQRRWEQEFGVPGRTVPLVEPILRRLAGQGRP